MKDLFNHLHRLHRYAGEPSMRAIADSTHRTLSHTAVHMALTGTRGVPTWPILYTVVQALGGDAEEFRGLWVRARDHEDGFHPAKDSPEPKVEPTHPLVASRQGSISLHIFDHADDGADLPKKPPMTLHASRQEIVAFILNSHPRRTPEILKSLPGTIVGPVLNSLPPETVRRLALGGDRELIELLLSAISPRRSANLLGLLSPSMATDILSRIPPHTAGLMLSAIEPDLAAQIIVDLRPDATRTELIKHISLNSLLSIFDRAQLRQKLQIMPAIIRSKDKLTFIIMNSRPPILQVLLEAMPMSDIAEILAVELDPDALLKLAQNVTPSRLAMALADMPTGSAVFLLAAVPAPSRHVVFKHLPDRTRIRLSGLLRVTQRAMSASISTRETANP